MTTKYGAFDELVKNAGALFAAAAAIVLLWRGQAPWGSWEEDLPNGPQRVASLVVAVLIGVLWFFAEPNDANLVAWLAIGLAVASLVLVILYVYLVNQYTYTKVVVTDTDEGTWEQRKVIGGFRLTESARNTISGGDVTVQDYFKGTAYRTDRVWTQRSLSLAQVTFAVVYICLIACGTLALTATALLVGFK